MCLCRTGSLAPPWQIITRVVRVRDLRCGSGQSTCKRCEGMRLHMYAMHVLPEELRLQASFQLSTSWPLP